MIRIQAKVVGLAPILKRLHWFNSTYAKDALARAVGKGARIAEDAAEQEIIGQDLRVTDQMLKSMGRRIVRYRSKLSVVGVVGPRMIPSFAIVHQGRDWDPMKYAHLVELGHGGPRPAPPYPFMAPAWNNNANAIRAMMLAELHRSWVQRP